MATNNQVEKPSETPVEEKVELSMQEEMEVY